MTNPAIISFTLQCLLLVLHTRQSDSEGAVSKKLKDKKERAIFAPVE